MEKTGISGLIFTKGFEQANMKQGDKIEFCAKSEEYQRGYNGRREDVHVSRTNDFKLSKPTK